MPVSQKELGQRLQAARDACRMTQEEVAHHLRVSCSTVTQMELGNRAITSLELERLAYLFGRDMREFFAEEFHEEDALVALFRAHPDVAETNGRGRHVAEVPRARPRGDQPGAPPRDRSGSWSDRLLSLASASVQMGGGSAGRASRAGGAASPGGQAWRPWQT